MRIPNILPMLLLAFSISLAAQNAPCEIYDLVVETGPCNSNNTYAVTVDFKVQNAANDQFDLWGNAQFLGTYQLSALPLTIDDFPSVGATGYVKVCINDQPDCCRIKQFVAPDCSQPTICDITNVTVETGACLPGGMYKLTLDFDVTGATNDFFDVWAGNGQYLGHFPLNQLPLGLPFPWGGGVTDKIKICINDNPNCCEIIEFQAPACFSPCRIENLTVETGECTSDSTYEVWIKFQAPAVGVVDSFGVWAGTGQFLGRYAYSDLPVHLTKFPWGGGSVDAVKVCVSNTCCREKEFNVPDCLAPPCGINDLKVLTGACTSPKTYKLQLSFNVLSPGTAVKFSVWADNGDFLGTYGLNQLPLTLNFPWNGDPHDALKVCLLDADGNETCCEIISFKAPDCLGVSCGIFNLEVKTGDCHPDGNYEVWVNFLTPVISPQKFGIWTGTGKFLGFFSVLDLPVYIKNFPASGGSTDKIIVCFNSACCETKEFNAPDCAGQPCGIVDLVVDPGNCTSDSTYQLLINFHLTTPAPGVIVPFVVYADNGQFLGSYTTANLPLTIQNFPWNGNATDAVKICIGNTVNTYCCRVKEFKAPDCLGDPCGIFNLKVETGACNNDGTYEIWVNFQTTSAAGVFGVWAGNGQFLGVFPFSALPLHIKNFPAGGGDVDAVKVCLLTPGSTLPLCCRVKEFKAPDCAGNPCGLHNLVVETGKCTSDSTYEVWIKFQLNNPTNTTMFAVYANGELYGQFPLSALPLHIPDFPWNGGAHDVVKVCIVSPLTVLCCETLEFKVPDCLQTGPCEIYDLKVETGGCTSDSTYKVLLNFKVQNPGLAAKFGVWANGEFLGYYDLSALPLTIQNFPWNGGANDVVKVCLITTNSAGSLTCCATREFKVPDCLHASCEIYDLKVETGKCNADGTYEVWINFKVDNGPTLSTHFGVWANGQLIGFFPLTQLPLFIPHFPTDGGPNDVVKICLSNTGAIGCCAVREFPVPDCVPGSACKIYDLVVTTGDCHNDGTYTIKIDFEVTNPGNDLFEVWAGNGQYLGHFPLSGLPLVIEHFPWGGGAVDVIKVCINDHPDCCKYAEFKAPDCAQGGPCDIYDLKVETGDCNPDGTYHAWINFKFNSSTPAGYFFGVWANGHFLGSFPLGNLPFHIEHFPTDGGPNDVVKVCLVTPNATIPLCCETKEFPVPDCQGGACKIYDLQVLTTPCLCGQFFAIVTFQHSNGGSGGFDIAGNGVSYGNFPYSQTQPIVLGPLDGNATTAYEFVVRDHLHPDCHDAVDLGVVDCTQQLQLGAHTATSTAGGKLVLSPNPTAGWLSVTAQLDSGTPVGEATVEIRQADGRLLRSLVMPGGGNFQLDVTELPAGVYRLSLQSAGARLESVFAKQ